LIARYLADRSALARGNHPAVAARLRPLIADGLVATCAIVDLEVLYSARSLGEYRAVLDERRALDDVPITPAVMDEAIDIQHDLAKEGQHRVPIPDLIVAAAARSSGLSILHYDADFDRIAGVTRQDQEWIVPAGSVD